MSTTDRSVPTPDDGRQTASLIGQTAPAPAPSVTDAEALIDRLRNAAYGYGVQTGMGFADLVESARERMVAAEGALVAALRAEREQRRRAEETLQEMADRKDAAYRERNLMVSALARLAPRLGWTAGLARTAIEGWSEDWHGCVYIDTPQGQLSWHYHDCEADLFVGLPQYEGVWDGHTTGEKYARLTIAARARAAGEGST